MRILDVDSSIFICVFIIFTYVALVIVLLFWHISFQEIIKREYHLGTESELCSIGKLQCCFVHQLSQL